jgi:2OG-Fe(II) oxygenase superfamily
VKKKSTKNIVAEYLMGTKSKPAKRKKASEPATTPKQFPSNLLDDLCTLQRKQLPLEILSPRQIWIVPNFLSPEECRAWTDYASSSAVLLPLEHVRQRGTRYMAARECHRAQVHDAVMAHRLYERWMACTKTLPAMMDWNITDNSSKLLRPVTFNPNLRLYRYETGMQFGKHVDDSNVIPGVGTTRLTVLVYLSECHGGGATRFFTSHNNNGEVAFAPVLGAMLLHVHGKDCLEHQGDAVTGGTKWVLRTDLVCAR